MIRRVLKHTFQWCACVVIGFLIVNLICYGYKRVPMWVNTPNGATSAYRQPGALMINSLEGFSIFRMDHNGYANPEKELAQDYVLMMGASHTAGKEVLESQRYSVLVNDQISGDGRLHAYNIGLDAAFLPIQIKYFKSGVEAFEDAAVFTIEIASTDVSLDELKNSIEQPEYDPSQSAEKFFKVSKGMRVFRFICNNIPLYAQIQANRIKLNQADSSSSENEIDLDEYKEVFNEALSLIRSETDKPIVFIYHPGVTINPDKSMSLDYSRTFDCFKEACENNGIDVIDSGNDFLEYYEKYAKVPYGFSNTHLGYGHLNAVGHEILAGEIIDYLEEKLK